MSKLLSPSSDDIIITDIKTYDIYDTPTSPTYIYKKTPVSPLYSPVDIIPVKVVGPKLTVEIDTGLNDSYIAQKQMNEYVRDRILRRWIHKPAYKSVLKFMKVKGDYISLVKSQKEYEDNEVSEDSKSVREQKAEYIGENILGSNEMRKILIKVMREMGYKWKDFANPHNKVPQRVAAGTAKRFIKKKLREEAGL